MFDHFHSYICVSPLTYNRQMDPVTNVRGGVHLTLVPPRVRHHGVLTEKYLEKFKKYLTPLPWCWETIAAGRATLSQIFSCRCWRQIGRQPADQGPTCSVASPMKSKNCFSWKYFQFVLLNFYGFSVCIFNCTVQVGSTACRNWDINWWLGLDKVWLGQKVRLLQKIVIRIPRQLFKRAGVETCWCWCSSIWTNWKDKKLGKSRV